jgi:CBS domain-containing protein
MTTHEPIQRVRIYLSERDTAEGRPLYLLVLERLQREGATGATAIRGVAGFGPGHRLRTAGPADLSSSLPVVLEWIDRAERVARVLPLLDDLIPNALITLEDLHVYRAALRSSGRFGERSVGEVMLRDIVVVEQATLLGDVVARMLESGQALIPVLDQQGRIAGAISAAEVARHGGLSLPLRVLGALAEPERATLLAGLPTRTAADVMATDPRTIYTEASIPQAVGTLVEWGLDALLVIDGDGRFAGLFGVEQALRAAISRARSSDSPVRDAELPTPVHLVMQRAVPTIAPTASLVAALELLRPATDRFLIVVADGQPLGILSDAQVLGRLDGSTRIAWLQALQMPDAPLSPLFEFGAAQPTVGDLAEPVPTVAPHTTQDDATLLMLEHGHERLVVVDDTGRLMGLLARRALLRALAQESVG